MNPDKLGLPSLSPLRQVYFAEFPLKIRGIKRVMIRAEVIVYNSPLSPSYLKRGDFEA